MEDIKPIIIKQTKNGKVFKCSKCNLLHVEFKNLNFNFTPAQYKQFAVYIQNLDGAECEDMNRDSSYLRKIMIHIGHQNFNIMFKVDELTEFNSLLNLEQTSIHYKKYYKNTDFDFYFFLN